MEHNSGNRQSGRRITEKQIKALLRWIPETDLREFLWIAQKFAAAGLNRR